MVKKSIMAAKLQEMHFFQNNFMKNAKYLKNGQESWKSQRVPNVA